MILSDGEALGPETDSLPHPLEDWPELVETIGRLGPAKQRAFAKWVAVAAVTEAGLDGDAAVLDWKSQPDGVENFQVGSALAALQSSLRRRSDELYDEQWDWSSDGFVEQFFVWQKDHALLAIQSSSHPDPRLAALNAAASAINAVDCTKVDVADGSSAIRVDIDGDFRARVASFVDAAVSAWQRPDPDQSLSRVELPFRPLTQDERRRAIAIDRERQFGPEEL